VCWRLFESSVSHEKRDIRSFSFEVGCPISLEIQETEGALTLEGIYQNQPL